MTFNADVNASSNVVGDGAAGTDSANARQVVIECRRVAKAYQSFPVLKNIDLRVMKGDVICIVGPSGGGKSTLLRTLNGLEEINDGTINVLGSRLPGSRENVRQIRSEVGMLFQSFNLFPHLTVRRNLTIAPMRGKKVPREQAEARAEQLLDRVGIRNQIDKYPNQLSGGQQQRVAIARALAMDPQVMLFDEPTSALDPEMVQEVLQVMRELAASGMTMLIVTHEMKFAEEVANRILFMQEGTIALDCSPDAFFRERSDPRVTRFLSRLS